MSQVQPQQAAITVRSLTYFHKSTYGNNPTTPALTDVNLSLPKGSRTILVGANGAGKSTLLQLLAGKKLIQDGEMLIFGKDAFRDPPPVRKLSASMLVRH
jgi:CCR4-NOT complex subunit CAF16